MSVRFILGRAGSGKTRTCLENIKNELIKDPYGPPIILLVPDQATFQMERMLINYPDLQGFARLEVLSFKRLASRVLAELGGGGGKHIKELGKIMALQSLIRENADNLRLFALSSRQYGFASCLSATLKELKMYNIKLGQLENTLSKLEEKGMGDALVSLKLHDLIVLTKAYRDYLGEVYIDPDEFLTRAALRINKSRLVKNAIVWIDGFRGFTPQEYSVLGALLVTAEKVNITFCLDPKTISRPPQETDLFHATWETYDYLSKLACELNIKVEPPLILHCKNSLKRAPALDHIEKELGSGSPEPFFGVPQGFKLIATANPRSEVEIVAREILRLTREEGMRFRDIGVIVPALDEYHDLIVPIFKDYGIPCFVDKRRPISHHPLVELTRAALEIASYGWVQEPIFRYLKTDLIPVERWEVDVLENYVLAHGIQGKLWLDEEPWKFKKAHLPYESNDDTILETVNDIRQRSTGDLLSFYYTLQEPDISIRDMAKAFFELLVSLDTGNLLDKWQRECIDSGDPESAEEHRQVWGAVIDLLDEVVQILGDRKVTPTEFSEIIEAGLESLTLGLIPPALDQVIVGSVDRSRHPPLKAGFLIGATYGAFPKRVPEDTILTDEDRNRLGRLNLILAPDSRINQFHEKYNVYVAFTRAWDFLMVSYPLADGEGKANRPSQVIGQIRELFPDLKEEFKGTDIPPVGEEALDTITSPKKATAVLSRVFQRKLGGCDIDEFWLDVYEWLVSEPTRREGAAFVLQSLGFTNEAARLSKPVIESCFKYPLQTSVTRLEKFAKCPFAYFAEYTLGLNERELYKLEPPGMGIFMHEAMKDLFSRLESSKDLAGMDFDEITSLTTGVVENLAPKLQNEILLSSARYRYMKGVLKRIFQNAVNVLVKHEKQSGFRVLGHEIGFGTPDDPSGLTVNPDDDQQITIVGRIDRVDIAESGGNFYLRVIDYKSSSNRLRLSHVYYGLALQLLVYLLAAVRPWEYEGKGRFRPAGAFYFPIIDPVISAKKPLDDSELDRKRMRELRMNGIIIGGKNIMELMDSGLKGGGMSDLIAAEVTRAGKVSKRSSACIIKEEDYEILSGFLRNKIKELMEGIQSGEIGIAPYRQGNKRACTYCDYKPVCGFDILIPGNEYRHIRKFKDDEFWGLIKGLTGFPSDEKDGK